FVFRRQPFAGAEVLAHAPVFVFEFASQQAARIIGHLAQPLLQRLFLFTLPDLLWRRLRGHLALLAIALRLALLRLGILLRLLAGLILIAFRLLILLACLLAIGQFPGGLFVHRGLVPVLSVRWR